MIYAKIISVIFVLFGVIANQALAENDEDPSSDLYVIEGKVFPWENSNTDEWKLMTHVMANGGEHYGFLRYTLAITSFINA